MKKGIICAVLALLVVLSMAGVAAASTIHFDQAGGTGGQTEDLTATKDSATPALTMTAPPTKVGFIFAGYFDATTDGNKYYNADGTVAITPWDKDDIEVTLHAQWTADEKKTIVDLTVSSEYTWTAPSDITLVSKGVAVDSTLKVSKLVIPTNKQLKIACTSAHASGNTFRLYNEHGGTTDAEKYLTYTYESATPDEFTNHILYFTDPITGDTPTEKTLNAKLVVDIPAGRSGTWSDTLTFTAEIVDKS